MKELGDSGLIDLGSDGYALTPLGHELREAIMPLIQWSTRWARSLAKRRGSR